MAIVQSGIGMRRVMMTTTETIGDLIRRKRLEKGWTQTELAERTGLSQRTISGLETGTRKATRNAAFIPLMDALGISYDEFAVAAGIVHTRHAAMRLRRLADELNADERVRLEQAHAALDAYLAKMDPEAIAYMVQTAEIVTRRLDD